MVMVISIDGWVSLLATYFLAISIHGCTANFIIATAITVTAILGDYLLSLHSNELVRAVVDSSTHGLIGLLSWMVVSLYVHSKSTYLRYELIISYILSSLVDVDHFVKARSIHLSDAMHLNHRPYLHCSTIPLLILVFNTLSNQRLRTSSLLRFSWIMWTAFTSHHVRDANRRGLWFYPFGMTPPLSNSSYILITLLLPHLTAFIMNNTSHPYSFVPTNYSPLTNSSVEVV